MADHPSPALKMNLYDSPYLVGGACLAAGAFLGYWLWRWKDRNVRAALAIKEQSILETARRQAETMVRKPKSRPAKISSNCANKPSKPLTNGAAASLKQKSGWSNGKR